MERYHNLIVLGFRFVYGIRILTPFVLGLDRQFKAGRFLILNSLGALLWSVVIALGGYLFGAALQSLLEDIRHYELEIMVGIALIGFIFWAIHRLRGK